MLEKEFQISSDIYDITTIQEGIVDFSDVAEIVFQNEKLSITWENEDEIQEVFYEFMNYILSL